MYVISPEGNWRLFCMGTVFLLASTYVSNVYAGAFWMKSPVVEAVKSLPSGVGSTGLDLSAQQITVNGSVRNVQGEPLAGVSVMIKNTSAGSTMILFDVR